MPNKIAVINNKCCKPKNSRLVKYIVNKLKEGIGAHVVFTEYPGHAEKIANNSSDYDFIIAVGGDGTVSEVVNGMNLETQSLAILPFGSANSFARDLGISSTRKALETINKNKKAKIDIINCQFKTDNEKIERYAIATSGFGFASRVATFANRYLKIAGPFCYSLSACFNFFNQEVIPAKIQLDNSPFKNVEFTNFLVNNTKHAGNTCVFPQANLRDSLLNLLFAKTNALALCLWSIGIITKTYFYSSNGKTARRLHIILNKPSRFMLDGEIYDSVNEIIYSVIPEKLSILTGCYEIRSSL
jgi:YegS/Rv2252/BmrU family lipid kinase